MNRSNINILSIPRFPLNFQQSIFLPQSSQQNKSPPILIKCYPNQKNQEDRLRSLQKASNNLIIKPFDCKFEGQAILFATQIQQMSLQTFIFLHKMKKIPIEKEFLKSFVKIYDTLNKLHKQLLTHGNLKPSNIFIKFPETYINENQRQISTDEIEWKLSQVGINPRSQNKYYSKSRLIEDNGSKSMFVDPKENDFYSLGVILLQMITLDPIEKVHNDIANNIIGERQYFEKMSKSSFKEHFENSDLLDFIRVLINPKEINNLQRGGTNLNSLYHNYSDLSKEQNLIVRPYIQYKQYILSYQAIAKFLTENSVQSVLKKIKKNIDKEQYTCSSVLKYINRQLDPQQQFFFPTSEQFFKFIYKYGQFDSRSQSEDLFKRNVDSLLFAITFTLESHIYYMPILMQLFKIPEMADVIIKKALDRYDSASQFFKDQTNGKQVWKAEDIFSFFHTIHVPFSQVNIQDILRSWAPNNKQNTFINSLKLQEFKKIFKDHISPKKAEKMDDTRQSKQKQQKVISMFKELSRYQQNLVHFFRKMPGENKWQVPIQKIRDEIKKYYKFRNSYEQKQIIGQILSMGRLNENDKSVDYIRLFMKIGIYEPIDLFRKVLVQRINEDGIGSIYKKYEKQQKGWTIQSLRQFCKKQYLEFDQKYQNLFFSILDKDDSKYITSKQFMFKLTGVKQFDIQYIIETIKNGAKNDQDYIFDAFLKVDRQKSFALHSADQLERVFQIIDEKIKFQSQHIQQLYNKFNNRKGQFQYFSFLRYFCQLDHIFLKACKIMIQVMYNDNFQKFFKIGLKGDQRKWKRESLSLINDQLVLKFTDKQLDKVWKVLDSNQQNSLTIQQIAEKFNKHVQTFQEFKGRNVQSLTDFRPKKKQQEVRNKIQDKNRTQTRQKIKTNEEDDLQKNQLVVDLKSMKLMPILIQCFKKSQSGCSVWIETQIFCQILKNQKVSCRKKFLETSFPLCMKKALNKSLFNYLKFFFMVGQFKKDPEKQKTQILRYILVSFCKQKRIKISRLFEDYRIKDQMMKQSKFQTIIKEILEDQLYYEDINAAWIFWGNPKFITIKNLQKIFEEENIQRLRDFLKDQKQTSSGFNSRQRETPELRSRQDINYDRKRKQSDDSRQPKRLNLIDKQRDDKYDRNRNQRRRDDSDSDWRNSQLDRKKQQRNRQQRESSRQKRERDRDIEQQNERNKNRNRKRKQSQRNSSQEQDNKRKPPLPQRKTSMENNLFDKRQKNQKPIQMSKKDLINKFQNELQQQNSDQLTRIFMDRNKVEKQDFSFCLTKYYNFNKKDAEDLSEHLSDFGQVKIQTIKKYLRPNSKQKQRKSKDDTQRYKKQKQKTVQFAEKTPQRFESDKLISPVTRQPKAQNKLINPLKRKLNTPLIKQQIKMIVRSFSQRYAIEELDKYFFDDSDVIYKDQFVKKCKQINKTLSQQNLQKIFQFLKPNEKEQVNILNFKISFSFDENFQAQQDYFPKELIKELQDIFNANDKDKSGSIEPSQVQALLLSLGFNQTQKQIENIFQKIDKNFDNKISFSQFKEFIQDFILPHLIEFENDVDELFIMLKMNDVFNTGCVPLTVLMAIIQRFGVKLTNQEGVFLAKYIGNQNDQIPIYDFLAALYYSSNPVFPPIVKTALYKIKLRRKLSLKQIQKTFSNISSNFVMAYTSRLIRSQQLKRSTAYQPVLHDSYMFYQDFYYRDFRRIQPSKNDKVLVDDDLKSTTMIVEIRVPQAAGVPIPQNQGVKGNILKRAMNITLFDMSAQCAKHSIITLQADWDSEIQDQWLFDMKNRLFYLKIANYEPKKFQKMILLFQLIITMSDNGRMMEISCGSASISIKELASVQNKLSKKLKLVSGIPTKAKQIDKVSVSKRSGWKNFLSSSNIESELSIDISNQKNLDVKETISKLHALPTICLVKKKALNYIWAFREYFAERCVDKDTINPQFINHHTVRAFLLSLDIEDISNQIISFWRDKIEQNIKTVWQSRSVLYNLLTDLHMILNSKQFELKVSNPCASVIQNKNLYLLRQKMVNEILQNIDNYVKNDLAKSKPYKRIKSYNYNYSPIAIQYGRGSLQNYINQNVIKVGKV